MRIRQNTPNRLIVEHVPWGTLALGLAVALPFTAGAIVFILDGQLAPALVFLGLGTPIPLLMIWFAVRRDQLVLDRDDGTAKLNQRSFRGCTSQTFPLSSLSRTYIAMNGTTAGTLYIHVSEGMDAGHHKISASHVRLNQATRARDAIAAWLGLPQT